MEYTEKQQLLINFIQKRIGCTEELIVPEMRIGMAGSDIVGGIIIDFARNYQIALAQGGKGQIITLGYWLEQLQ